MQKKIIGDFRLLNILEQSIPLLIGIFIFLNPFPHTTAIKEICYYATVFFAIILISSRKIDIYFKTPLLIPFVLFVLWVFVGIFFAVDKENSIHDFYSHLLRYIILYYILTNFFCSIKRILNLSWIIIISSTLFSIAVIIYYYFLLENPFSTSLAKEGINQITATIIGVISVFASILSLNHLRNAKRLSLKIYLASIVLILLTVLLMTQSRASFIAIFFGIFFFFFDNKKWMAVLVCLILIITILSPMIYRFQKPGVGNISRITNTYVVLEVIKEYPIVGVGFGLQTYGKLDLDKYQKKLSHKHQMKSIVADPHNIILDITVRLGVVGLILFLYIIIVFFKMCWDTIKCGKEDLLINWGRCLAAAFVAVFVIGSFHPIFSHMPEVVICTIFSMITIVWHLNKEIVE